MIKKNILANLLSNGWGVISVFLFIPLYIKFLGIEAYGLIGFYATLIGFLSLADMGFTVTLKREMARLSAINSNLSDMKHLLRTYEIAYGFISLFISITIWFCAPIIAAHWLKTKVFQPNEMVFAIRLMGISVALQLPSGLFIGGLMGLQRQVWANTLNIGVGVFRGIGAVFVLWLFPPTIFIFFLWQLISNIIYLYVARFSLWNIISSEKKQSRALFKWELIYSTGHFALSMASMSLIGVLLSQSDKLVVGKLTSLEMFSYYSIAGALASVPIVLSGAVGTALFPRFVELIAQIDRERLSQIYKQTCEIIGIIIVPIGITLILFSGDFIYAWTGSNLIAKQAQVTASLLLIGQLLQAITVIPYNFALAHGNVKFSQKIGLYSILLITPLLVLLTSKFGIVGAGMSWLILNIFTLPINIYYLHRQALSNDKMWRNCIRGIIRPLLCSLPCILLGKLFFIETSSRFIILLQLGAIWVVSFTLSTISFPAIRTIIIKNYKSISSKFLFNTINLK